MISYGMGEHSIVEIADALASGLDVKDITFIRGTVYRCKSVEHIPEPLYLPSFEEIKREERTVCKKLRDPASEYGSISGEGSDRRLWQSGLCGAESTGISTDRAGDG